MQLVTVVLVIFRGEKNLGAVENFNRVFRFSSGNYFMWAAGHDLWAHSFVSKCVEALEKEPSAVLCYPRAQFIYEDGQARLTCPQSLYHFLC
jgi:GT2 family glycosyltransferase